ncbi:RING/U-box superfamily protein [Striga asiatica]|uniref:RING/U-box superfamily protein n=1 Tax=Striga asiatica TaxID=4170 RepID=A0A5A7PEY9_STRAF|nr:RING/U-box superfamily protein [Striga asiatica]
MLIQAHQFKRSNEDPQTKIKFRISTLTSQKFELQLKPNRRSASHSQQADADGADSCILSTERHRSFMGLLLGSKVWAGRVHVAQWPFSLGLLSALCISTSEVQVSLSEINRGFLSDMLGPSFNLITTIIGFVLSAAFIVFVFTRLICVRLRSIEARQLLEVGSLELARCEIINGIEPAVVDSIPREKFDYEAFGSRGDSQCTICLVEYEERESLGIIPICGHSFHLSCIDAWLSKRSTCPICRLSVQQDV